MGEVFAASYYSPTLPAGCNIDELGGITWGYVEPTAPNDMTLVFYDSESNLDSVISIAHTAGKKVRLHMYGQWGWYSIGGNDVYTSTTLQDQLFDEIEAIKDDHPGLDGVYWSFECAERLFNKPAYTNALSRMYDRLNPLGMSIVCGETWRWSTMTAEAVPFLDHLVVKVYDLDENPPTMEHYGTMTNFQNSLGYWVTEGFPKNKLLGAIQLGAYQWNGSIYGWSQSYGWIVDNYDPSPNLNLVGPEFQAGSYKYQGLTLQRAKAQWLADEGYKGAYIYHLSMDKHGDPRSSLTNIYNIVKTAEQGGSGVTEEQPGQSTDDVMLYAP